MELNEQIQGFQDFFEQEYHEELLERARTGRYFLVVDFARLARFNPGLAELLLDNPEELIKAAELSLKHFDLPVKGEFFIRFQNLPSTQQVMIRDVRAAHLGKFLQMDGIVRQKSDVRPQVTSANFECPSCGNIIPILQLEQKFREPSLCTACGRKGRFRLLSKKLVDAQKIVLEESPEELEGGEQPKRLNIFLKHDLVSPMTEKQTNPGAKVRVVGVVKEVPITLSQGGQSVRFDLVNEANFIEPLQEDYTQIEISKEEEEEILALSRDPAVFAKITESIAPSIYGMEKVKEALVLQLLGGVHKERGGSVKSRGDIHILLIGDPGAGKSQLLKRISHVAPKARFVSGKGASGAGLTASVVRDEFLRGWALEAGALVLANKGICCIDELDKMTPEDRSAMHEALEQQTVTISKANIQATLRSETTVLAAANPKFGRFDPYDVLAKQIDLPSTLINRFDLIFPIRDLPEREKDERLASFILKLHQSEKEREGSLDTEFLRKYISYAKQRCKPRLSTEALEEIKDYYIKMRSSSGEENEAVVKSIPISARQLEALIRLTEASAKVRLADEATKRDAKIAIDLVHHCLTAIGLDPKTGRFDIDRFATSITASQRSNIIIVKEIIKQLEEELGRKDIEIKEIIREAEVKGLDRDSVEEVLAKLKRSGDIYEPKRDTISRV